MIIYYLNGVNLLTFLVFGLDKLKSIHGADIHFWYGTKEAFVAKPQAEHLKKLYPAAKIEVFQGMNHGQLLVDHPERIAERMLGFVPAGDAVINDLHNP